MKLSLRNVGKLKEADIKIDAITVIAGKNDTGKSTISKSLYSIFNGFYKINKKMENEKKEEIQNQIAKLERLLRANESIIGFVEDGFVEDGFVSTGLNKREIANQIYNKFANNTEELSPNEILNILFDNGLKTITDKEKNKNLYLNEQNLLINEIIRLIKTNKNEHMQKIIQRQFNNEFFGQINNLYQKTNGKIKLNIKNEHINLLSNDNTIQIDKNNINIDIKVPYIDNSLVLENLQNIRFINDRYSNNHSQNLKKMLISQKETTAIKELSTEQRLDNILNIINNITPGKLVKSDWRQYAYEKNGIKFKLQNISDGIKIFIIIKTLIEKGYIQDNGTIILDEPEIHLHPEFQLILAELLVLLQKEFNLHILLSTHSPYFLKAIEVYSKKYETNDKCKYYLTKNISKTEAIAEDVTNKIDEIYKLLAEPYNTLHNLEENM